MAEVTLLFDELEANDLPPVCVACGARHDVAFVQRRFAWAPVFAPPLLRMIMTKRLTADIPLCVAHGGPRLFAYPRWYWWGLTTVAISADRLTIGGAAEEFAEALDRWRWKRDRGEIAAPRPRHQVEVGRGPGGGLMALKVLGIIAAVMMGLMLLMTCGMFGLMGLGLFLLPKVGPPAPAPPTPVAGPATAAEPKPEGVVAGLLAVAPQAGGPAAVPWAPLALAARKETFHLLDDADLNKALADLKSPDPNIVAAAAQKLAKATPTAGRRKETAAALLAAMGNPFPSAKQAAAEAQAAWGTADEMPALIQMLADPFPDVRAAAMTALAGLKNERAAVAVAARLSDFFDREKARQSLEFMGPVAEPAVLPLLNGGDAQTRVEACSVLKAVGTMESVPALEKASGDPDLNVARAAAEALQAVRARP